MWINCLPQIDEARACTPICNWTKSPSSDRQIFTTLSTRTSPSSSITFTEFANSIPHLLLGHLRLLSRPTGNYLPHFLLAQSPSSSITFPEFANSTIIYHLFHYFSISKDPWHNILNHFTSWNLFLAHRIHLYHYQLRWRSTLAVAFLIFDLFSP